MSDCLELLWTIKSLLILLGLFLLNALANVSFSDLVDKIKAH